MLKSKNKIKEKKNIYIHCYGGGGVYLQQKKKKLECEPVQRIIYLKDNRDKLKAAPCYV